MPRADEARQEAEACGCACSPLVMMRREGPAGHVRVLDIETAPDPHAQVLARRRRIAARGSPLHEVVARGTTSAEEMLNAFHTR